MSDLSLDDNTLREIEDYAFILDKEGNIIEWNKGAEKMKGYIPNEIIGKNFDLFYTTEDREKNVPAENLNQALKNGKLIAEGWRVKKDGLNFWANIVIKPIYNRDSIHTGFLKITRDLTERKTAEDTLRLINLELQKQVKSKNLELDKSEKIFNYLIEKSENVIALCFDNGRLNYVSPTIHSLLGYSNDEMEGKFIFDFLHTEDKIYLKELVKDVLIEPVNSIHSEQRLMHKNGSFIWCDLNITNLLEDPSIQALLFQIRDITTSKIAADDIKRLNRMYAFLSSINQSIVHTINREQLFKSVCESAINIGQFKLAWVGIINHQGKLDFVESCGDLWAVESLKTYSGMDFTSALLKKTTTGKALASGTYAVTNSIKNAFGMNTLIEEFDKAELRSNISLPLKSDGKVVGILSLNSNVEDFFNSEEIRLLVEIASDISYALDILAREEERKNIELKIAENETKLKKAQKLGKLGYWEVDFDTQQITLSEEASNIYGLVSGNIYDIQEKWMALIHKDDVKQVLTLLQNQRDNLDALLFEHRIIKDDGNIHYIHAESKYEFTAEGKSIKLYGIVQDITESHKAAEQILKLNLQLETANEQLLTILNTLPASIALLNKDGDIVAVNKSWKQFAKENGYNGNEYGLGLNYIEECKKFSDIPEIKVIAAAISDILAGNQQTFSTEYKCHSPQEKRWFNMDVKPLENVDNGGAVIMHINITDRVVAQKKVIEMNNHLEDKVRERTKDLTEVNTALEAFSYSVSHDLRSPLRTIIGFIKIISQNYSNGLDTNMQNMLQHISSSADRMNAIIDDLLALSKGNRTKLNISKVDMHALVLDIWDGLSFDLPNKAKLVISNPLPTIMADGSMLRQAIVNLLSNAIKYTSKINKPLVIIGSETENSEVTFFIKDNGAGFDMSNYKDLFQPFHRLHSLSEFEGTGIGLVLVKKIIERHGGKVWAQSIVNEGATFFFSLKASEEEEETSDIQTDIQS